MHRRFWGGNVKKADHSKDLGIDGKTILKWMLKTGLEGIDPIRLLQKRDKWWPLVKSSQPLGSTKFREFHDELRNNSILKDYSAAWS
jgi:hypothetical protein